MSKLSIIKELLIFCLENKKWWLIPIILILLLVGLFLVFSQSSSLAPYIYSLF
ncbi:MAG: DUF5989 family protein [Spirochaetia bacterium]|nr:DUF5989 family protein [Spirochaetia bacterium]